MIFEPISRKEAAERPHPMNDPPQMVGPAPGVPTVSAPGAALFHDCPTCGHGHWPDPDNLECMCGHPRNSHDDNGGRRKKAPCTVWDPIECPCEDYHQ